MAKQARVTWSVVREVSTSVVREGRFHGRLLLSRVSNIAFGKMVWSNSSGYCVLILRGCEIFRSYSGGVLFCGSVVLAFIGPKECAESLRCFEKIYAWLLLRKAVLCSLYLVVNYLPVCPTLAFLQSGPESLMLQILNVCLSV